MNWNEWLWACVGFTVGSLAGVFLASFFYWLAGRDEQKPEPHAFDVTHDHDCECRRAEWRGE